MKTKKIFILSFLSILLLPLFTSLILAVGVNDPVTNPAWFVSVINFLGLGATWAQVIAAIAVIIMIFAATYDILAFTAFEKNWVKFLIALGVSLLVAVSRGVVAIAAILMSITGGSVALAVVIAIGIAVVFFVIGTFFKGKMKAMKYREKAEEATGAYELAKATKVAEIKAAKAAARAAASP